MPKGDIVLIKPNANVYQGESPVTWTRGEILNSTITHKEDTYSGIKFEGTDGLPQVEFVKTHDFAFITHDFEQTLSN